MLLTVDFQGPYTGTCVCVFALFTITARTEEDSMEKKMNSYSLLLIVGGIL